MPLWRGAGGGVLMAIDLDMLFRTPDLGALDPAPARLVTALRYIHCARHKGTYSHRAIATHLGSDAAVRALHVLLSEYAVAVADPIVLNPPCQPRLSYDEMLFVDLLTAAIHDDRRTFDWLLDDMLGQGARNAVWTAARRLARG